MGRLEHVHCGMMPSIFYALLFSSSPYLYCIVYVQVIEEKKQNGWLVTWTEYGQQGVV
jgi:hypothetical protein